MSFSSEQKENIVSQSCRSSCCRRALLQGALFAKGNSGETVSIVVEKRYVAEFLSKIASEIYNVTPNISTFQDGGRRIALSFKSKSAAKYIANISHASDYFLAKCDLCTSSFLKGVFLAAGRISDPKKQYSLEFSVGERSELLVSFLETLGLTPRISEKQSGRVVYFKNSSDIEDFCGFAGLNKAMFSFMDAKVEGELRKNAMRVANCETNNIEKAVVAARRQLSVIQALDKSNLLSFLPEELEATARLRMKYADLSLAQLAAVSVPPISKPGLSHRLKKIIEIGEQLLKQKSMEEGG